MAHYLTELVTARVSRGPAVLRVVRRWRLKPLGDPADSRRWIAHAMQWRRPRGYRVIRNGRIARTHARLGGLR